MDFFISKPPPLEITIDGTAYQLPRFLTPQMTAWAATIRRQNADEATEHLSPDDKARFLLYFQMPPMDTADVVRRATTPEGADYVIDVTARLAGVPDNVRANLIAYGDPMMKRYLAEQLVQVPQTLTKLGVDQEAEKKDPLSPPPGESGDSAGTGPVTPPASAQPTVA